MTTDLDVFDEIQLIENAGLMKAKGYSFNDVAEVLTADSGIDISYARAKDYVRQYYAMLERMSEDDPFFLEKIQFNTIKALAEFDEISKEAWETVALATEEGMVGARTQALKLALDTASKKAQLHQLMTGGKSDSEFIARMQKAETVNQVVSKIVRDVIAECDRCRPMAHTMLREAYALMEQEFEGPGEMSDNLDFDATAEVITDV